MAADVGRSFVGTFYLPKDESRQSGAVVFSVLSCWERERVPFVTRDLVSHGIVSVRGATWLAR